MPDEAELSRRVTAAFRSLAEEHAEARRPVESRRAWQLLEGRLDRRQELAPKTGRRALIAAAGVVAAAAVPAAFFAGSGAALSYELTGARVDQGVIRTQGASALVKFSDRSHIRIEPQSELAVDVVGPHAALTRVNRGALDVAVEHESSSDWRFFAGPYEVRVTGTSFRLAWEPKGEVFSLRMHEGRVRVLGPDGLDRPLVAGESLDLSRKPLTAALASEPPASPPVVTTPAAGVDKVAGVPARNRAARATPGWPALVASGHFGEVVEAATGAGLEAVFVERPAPDLKALAEAAHYSGRPAIALRAWSSLRQRFPSHAASRQAAFYLGRIHDQQGRRADALSWLDTYLREASGDVYAAEARGRRLILIEKLQGAEAARVAARDYLGRHPGGPYARTARAILGER